MIAYLQALITARTVVACSGEDPLERSALINVYPKFQTLF